jgi:hypothetical protein
MNKKSLLLPLITFLFLVACQLLFPTASNRNGTVVPACADLVQAFRAVQPGSIPSTLLETGIKQGGEFDVNDYFTAFTHISMQDGYALDYVYQVDSLGAYPILYAHPVDQAAYASTQDLPAGLEITDYLSHVSIDGTEQGYFEFVALALMARQFYLDWHANYNDTEIVCNEGDVSAIIEDINDGSFGLALDASQQVKARTMTNIEPLVRLTGDTAVVELIFFTKWGGFYRSTYTVNRSFPHAITDVKEENIVPYDCGIVF